MKKTFALIMTVVLLVTAFSVPALAAEVNDGIKVNPIGSEFKEEQFTGMIITKSESGAPIVDDPGNPQNVISSKGTVVATTVRNTWLYRDRRLNTEVLIIPEGKAVVVLQTDSNYGSAQITYAGATGWVYCSNLRLG